ncbi:hypothetical protein MUK42_03521 [Musa troglodytarum]|uniref:Uncharacterized protein n=1 Tax=Musa troglodytarum TaxID=320322 RepID=A0A9E7HPY9_9LILI|nr:hypothetical protein MUK42_03521 [Musa troglodytarum]
MCRSASKLIQLSLENYIDVDLDGGGYSPSPYSSVISFSWEQCVGIPKSLSQLVTTKDAFTHPLLPLPPLIYSHSEFSTTCKKCSITSPNLFMVTLALCSNGLLHDGDDVDELQLVPDVGP